VNIFVTDPCPIKCAKYLDDSRIGKMIVESVQLISTAYDGPYRKTHCNHPCTLWLGKSYRNLNWLLRHLEALNFEYMKRFNHFVAHKSFRKLKEYWDSDILKMILDLPLPHEFVNCAANKSLGISYKDWEDIHLAYQMYLNDRWESDKREPTWGGCK